jgi:hypothetical protein
MVIVNPGGLQARADFAAGFSRNLDIAASLGYSPMLPFYGYVFDSFSDRFYPAGFYGRVGVLPFKRLWGFIGVELTPRLTLVKTAEDAYTVSGTMTALTLNGLYQRRFMDYRMAIKLRLGGGAAAITGIRYEHSDGTLSEEVGAAFFFAAAGASLEWTLWRGLFVEAGADYIQGISPNSPAPGFIQAGAGWRF